MMLHRVHLATWAVAASILAAPSASAGNDPDDPTVLAASTTATLLGRLELSLEDAVKMGLENNLDVQVQRFAPFISEQDLGVAWGAFDPEWFANFNHDQSERFVTSGLAASGGDPVNQQKSWGGGTGLRTVLPVLGTSLEARLDTSRSTTNLSFLSLNPVRAKARTSRCTARPDRPRPRPRHG